MNGLRLFWRLAGLDYYVFMGLALPAGFWLILAGVAAIGTRGLERALLVGIPLSLAGLGLAAWRFWKAAGLLRRGQEARGVISRVWFYRDRGRITCTYRVGGREVQSGLAVRPTRRTLALRPGQKVRLLFNPQAPRVFILPELFD